LNDISKNIVTKNRFGVVLDVSTYNEVYDNYVEDNQIGIFVGSSALPSESREQSLDEYYNNIYRNTILNNHIGIDIEPASFTNVFQNNIMNNDYGISINAPYHTMCNYNNIYQNNIHNNTYGIHAITGGSIIAANNISENNFFYNAEGISLCSYNFILNGNIANNTFSNNNFIGNNNTAYFEDFFICIGSNECHGPDQWVGNYWGKARLLPYLIKGKLKIFKFSIPWVTFDWHPAKEPYDIGGI
jgi:parallel beta-helix repeat protein